MTYEGQVAGVPDAVPHQRAKSLVVRRLKDASVSQLRARRAAIADALRDVTEIGIWNAGGSGSIESSTADPVVTEVTAGSGLLVPALFDRYQAFEPHQASFFGLPVTRRPSPDVATVHGGGLIASGPGAADRLPVPWAPAGLHLTGLEGAGEVQTPLTGHPAALLRIGDVVWFRHAKSGEPFEHTKPVRLLSGEKLVESVPTYRGHGLAFWAPAAPGSPQQAAQLVLDLARARPPTLGDTRLVSIDGPAGSGKTTLAATLARP